MHGTGFSLPDLIYGADSLITVAQVFLAFIGVWMVVVGLIHLFGPKQLWICIGSVVLLFAFGIHCTRTLVMPESAGWTSYSPLATPVERSWPPVVLTFWAMGGGLVLFSIVRLVRVRQAANSRK
jgi:hypothetical protein